MNTLLTKWNPFKAATWDPFKGLGDLDRRMDAFFGTLPLRTNGKEEPLKAVEWAPAVDITEDDKEYVVKAELPELKKEEVKVTVENGVLEISGERKLEKEEKNKKYHRIERSYGAFTRMFTLPETVVPANVKAEFKDGMLTVHLPKTENAKNSLEVKVD